MKHFLGNPQPLRPKRKRLSHACNYCRLKKIRCDDAQPGCGACQSAGIDCITNTRQQPDDPSLSQRTAEKDVLEESQGQQFNPRLSSQSREIDISPRAGTCGTIQGVPILQDLSRLSPLNSKSANKVSSLNEPDGDDYLPLIPSTLPEAGTARIATQWLRIAFNRLKLYPPRDWIEFEKDAVSQRISLEPFFGNPGPALPNADEIRAHTARFVADVLVIYPLISTSLVRRLLDQITCIPLKITSVRVQDPSVLAFGYLVSIVGMKLQPKSSPQQLLIERYLGHCTSLLGHLLAERSVTSLQMVLLLAIILRVCDRLDLSWDVLMVALTMAKSLNCDRNCALLVTGEESEAKRAWWCLYAFEKILAFETGRQTTIVDRYLSTIKPQSEKERKAMTEPSASIHIHKEDSAEYKYALISLVNILGEMTKRSSQCWGLDELKACRRDAAIARIFDTAGEIDSMLMDWQHFQRANFLYGFLHIASLFQSTL
ncbi:uncharacterized protein BHQ10_009602 [Talaromyces amestolkiae]|uniref:Zn(2)-C6 fungal-type domain-containing protein n=1 Tax=Talaromyces amestolkiae TaxID=1196081 RepID=A0A364LCN6_TALAM|nr:uncharacterized protein BHQ10_009602 [Talaromyces amestolkiae]RAO73590.1 hypothetical protein BHQ10_009602 [Talaromyces amestolkiae]